MNHRSKYLKRPYFFKASYLLGRTSNEPMLVSEMLLALLSNNLRTTGAILVQQSNDLNTRTFSGQFQILQSSILKVSRAIIKGKLGTKKRFSNFSIKVGVTVNSATSYSKEGSQACRQNSMYTNGLTFRRSKPDPKIIPAFFWFFSVIFNVRRD